MYLTTAELSKELGLKSVTLDAWRQRGEGPPYVRLGRAVRYLRADVDAWVLARRVGPLAGEEQLKNR